MTRAVSRRAALRRFAQAAFATSLVFSWPSRRSRAAGRLELDGAFTQGGLLFGRADPGSAAWLDGDRLMVGADGRFLLGFGRDAEADARLRVRHADGSIEERDIAIAQRTYGEQRIEGLPQNTVTPDPEERQRIAADNARVKAARRAQAAVAWYQDGFAWPVQGPITGVYGTARILNGEPRQPHYGVDIAAAEGTPVASPADGIVRLAAADMLLTGGTLVIDHGQGLSSTLMHLSAVLVKPGRFVGRGEIVGRVGHTGRATGPHLDWRMNWRDARLDPALLVEPMPAAAATLAAAPASAD
ncbi:MAG: M23 family metallopeptidase [Pseudomonadota bacterium]